MKKIYLLLTLLLTTHLTFSQSVPAEEENIPYLVTFGNKADKSWGDDDFSQTFFFKVPKSYKGMVYVRVYDPEQEENWMNLKAISTQKLNLVFTVEKVAFRIRMQEIHSQLEITKVVTY